MKKVHGTVTLNVHGRERKLSKQELIAILEEYVPKEAIKSETTENAVQVPTATKWFEVNPLEIDQNLFETERKDIWEERTRKRILEAFDEVKKKPEKYGKKFKTMMPKKTWVSKSVANLMQLACKIGDHNADWVEQSLEWAQRISNGESWEDVCIKADTAKWYRLVVWKYGNARIVGGSRSNFDDLPASYVDYREYDSSRKVHDTVPLVVSYDK